MEQNLFSGTHLASVRRFDLESNITSATHCVFASAPPGHDAGEEDYPLLVVLDANLLVGTSVEAARLQGSTREAQEVIVACVGTAADLETHTLRRLRDYSPEPFGKAGDEARASPVVQMLERRIEAAGLAPEAGAGGAAAFLRFLEEELVPQLARRYRVREGDIGLAGHSGGGMFATYALLAGSPIFSRYIVGSATGPWLTPVLGEMEQSFVRQDCDPARSVFYGVGGLELQDPALGPALRSGFDQFSRLSKVPGLAVELRVFPEETHASAAPQVLAAGLRFHWPGMTYAEMARSRFA